MKEKADNLGPISQLGLLVNQTRNEQECDDEASNRYKIKFMLAYLHLHLAVPLITKVHLCRLVGAPTNAQVMKSQNADPRTLPTKL